VVTEEAAATGSAEDAEAWAEVMRGYTPPPEVATARGELGLASPLPPQLQGWDELLDPREPLGYGAGLRRAGGGPGGPPRGSRRAAAPA
jgi:hypothetical protein